MTPSVGLFTGDAGRASAPSWAFWCAATVAVLGCGLGL